jgi:hypothetical protein
MAKPLPQFTMPVGAFPGFSDRTKAALNKLFEGDNAGPLRALIIIPSQTVNSKAPQQVGFIYDEDGQTFINNAHTTPLPIVELGAAAAFMVSHDPNKDSIVGAANLMSRTRSASRIAVTAQGCVVWPPDYCHASKADEAGYQHRLGLGTAFFALINSGTKRSAHERLQDQKVLGSLADSIYQSQMFALSQRKRTGLHRKVSFSLDQEIRNPHLARNPYHFA